MRTERAARAVMLFIITAFLVIFVAALALSTIQGAAPGRGQAGEHGKHKGRPFVSDSSFD